MPLDISKRQIGGAAILDLSGRISLRESSLLLGNLVNELAANGAKRILLNLAGVSYIDSSGIGELVSADLMLRNQGGELTLFNLNNKLHELLEMTNLHTVLDIQDDEAAALRSRNLKAD